MVGRARHTAAVQEDLEGGAQVPSARLQMHAVRIAVETLGEDHAVERPVELDVDAHVRLFALHLQMLDLRAVVRGGQWPRVVSAAATAAAPDQAAATSAATQQTRRTVYW